MRATTVRDIRVALQGIAEPRSENPALAQYKAAQAGWLQNFENLAKSDGAAIHPLRVVKEAATFFPRDAICVTDGGNTTIWTHYLTRIYEPGSCLWSGDSGMGGGGLPKAIAAKLVCPQRPVYAICGDGFFMMNVQELETAVRLGTNIVMVVNNDRAYGMIKAGQDGAHGQRYIGVDFADVRYDRMAEAAGWYGERVEDAPADRSRPAAGGGLGEAGPAGRDHRRRANLTPPDFATVVGVWLEGITIPQY